jgi:formylglycine-generating enzyme required for sulfatase activity
MSQIVATAAQRVRELNAALGLAVAPRFRDRLRDGSPGPAMQRLEGGWFVMGSDESEAERFPFEGPVRAVKIAPFALSQGEISFELYGRFAADTGRPPPSDEGWGRGERPSINVSWHDAAAFADWLTEQTGRSCRLPTEAQWEYAARAGRSSPFATGDCITTAEANYNGQQDYDRCGARTGLYRAMTLPMTALPPNRWGLYHMHGNVAEWVADCWHESYQGAPLDGSVWGRADGGDCSRRMVRGGSWRYEPGYLRSAARFWAVSAERSAEIGFRVACDP